MRAQSLNALGQAYLLVGKDNVVRIDAPETPIPIALDDYRRAKAELQQWHAHSLRPRATGD
jgi:hypothetical protein